MIDGEKVPWRGLRMTMSFNDFVFPKYKKPTPNLYEGEPVVHKPGVCMRAGCGLPRWEHPEKGSLVLCEDHSEEVFRGETTAPPLLTCRDYVSTGRRTFLVDHFPDLPSDESEKP